MDGLFDIGVEPEIEGALEILRVAQDKYGVAWPFQEEREIKMLRLMHEKHPLIDLQSLTEGFMIWCMGDEERTSQIKNWPQTLWTRVRNEERYKGKKKGWLQRSGASPQGHNVVSGELTYGW